MKKKVWLPTIIMFFFGNPVPYSSSGYSDPVVLHS